MEFANTMPTKKKKKKKKSLLKVKTVPEQMQFTGNGIGIDPGQTNQITATDVLVFFIFCFFVLPKLLQLTILQGKQFLSWSSGYKRHWVSDGVNQFLKATMKQEDGFKDDLFNNRLAACKTTKEKVEFLQGNENPYLNKVSSFFFL